MALRFPARTKGSTTQTGTLTTFTIDEAYDAANQPAGWRSFTKAVTQGDLANGDTIPIAIVDTTVAYDGSNMIQVCTATWNNTTKQFTVVQNYQPAISPNWGGGRRDVLAIDEPAMFLLLAGGTLTGLLKILISGSIITPATETSLVVQRSATSATDAGISIISGTAGKSRVNLGDTADEKAIAVIGDNNTNSITFHTNGVDRQVIDSSGVLKVTSAGNSYDAFAGGAATVLIFYQATAPTGWTKVTTQNDKALRVVSGTGGGSGGSRVLSSASVGDHTLTITEIPPHDHAGLGGPFLVNSASTSRVPTGSGTDAFTQTNTAETGGGDPHTHALALAYIDVIPCSKN